MNAQIKYLLKTSRPRFWMYVLGPAILGIFISLNTSNVMTPFLAQVFAVVYFTLPANLLIYGVNDIYDGDTDQYNPKKSTYENKHSQSQTNFLTAAIALTNLPFLIYFALVFNTQAILFLVAFLFFSIQYSATPIRAKSKPFIDGIFNFLYVAPALVVISISEPQVITQASLPIILAGTFWCMAMHCFSAIPDIEADQKAKLKTTAVFLGQKGAFIYCFALYLATAVITTCFFPLAGAPLFVYPVMILYTYLNQEKTFQVYKYFPYINTLVGFLITLQLIYNIYIS